MTRLLTFFLCSALVFSFSTSDIAEAKKKTGSKAKSSVVKSSSSKIKSSKIPLFKSCQELNKKYPGGVALSANVKNVGAKTKYKPFISPELYNVHKKRLDRDKDGIACER
ncbi:MAG: excalibur calcium-binding domain-containing protein [Anoxybacillus ayderensis]|nr:excalibur calcium-binding domain-containing protein [Anoxybacillus ayderensis]